MKNLGGGLGDLRETMMLAHGTMGRLADISRNIAMAANGQLRGASLGRLAGTSMSSAINMPGVPYSTPVGDPVDFGIAYTDNVKSSTTNPATGNTTTIFTDGTIQITNAQGQDITSNFITVPEGTTPLQQAAINVSDTISNATDAVTGAASSALSTVGTATKQILMVGVIIGVMYAIYELDKK